MVGLILAIISGATIFAPLSFILASQSHKKLYHETNAYTYATSPSFEIPLPNEEYLLLQHCPLLLLN